jgi:polyvinyl alcohol dehydrogenase (cytochrome)
MLRSRTLRLFVGAALVSATGVGAGSARAATRTVIATTSGFAPPVVLAAPGDSIDLRNADLFLSHTLTADATSTTGAPLFDSGSVLPGVTATVSGVATLPAGVYAFHCTFHPWMKGVMEVTAPGGGGGGGVSTEWPLYGADLANTRTVAGGPAASAVPTMAQAWRADFTDGDFTGTPVVSGGVVYVGSNGGKVRAIQAIDTPGHPAGSVLWTTTTAGGSGEPINGSLAVAGGLVYVPVAKLGSPYVLALNAANGQAVWSATLDASTDADVYGSPTIAPDSAGRLLVLQGVSAVSGDPASPLRGSVSAFDAMTGAPVWKTYMVPVGFNGGAVWSTPAVDTKTGSVFVGTGNAYTGSAASTTDAIVKLDINTGAIEASFQATANDVFSPSNPGLDFDFGASPNLMSVGGRDLVGEGQKAGAYWTLDRASMAPVWHTQVGPSSAVGGILGSTAYDMATTQIVGPISAPGYVWSLQAGSGLPNWVTAAAADPLHWSPTAISNGVVYSLATSGFVVAWLEQTGTPLAQLPLNTTPGPGGSTPSYSLSFGGVAVADGLVIANTGTQGSNGSVVAFRAS